MKQYLLFFGVYFSTLLSSFSQSLIAGIPSADVAEKGHLEITHETQYHFWNNPHQWNSFNFMCWGLNATTEATLTLNNLDNYGSKDLAIGAGGKKIFNLFKGKASWENKVIVGGNLMYGTQRQSWGIWSYGLYSLRIPTSQTRLTGGLSYGTFQTYGFRKKIVDNLVTLSPNNVTTVLLGFEQPLTKKISLIADWYSGKHAIAALITAIQYDIGHHVFICGYKKANNTTSGKNALIIELMINIRFKSKSH